MNELGLKPKYIDDIGFRTRFYQMTSLAFLAPMEISDCWTTLKLQFEQDEVHLVRYFETTWVGSDSSRPRYPPTLWSLEGKHRSQLPTTTNASEWAHRSRQGALVHLKPGMCEWLQMLQRAQAIVDLMIAAVRRGDEREPGRTMQVKMREMQNMVDRRASGQASIFPIQMAKFRMSWSLDSVRYRDSSVLPSSTQLVQEEPSDHA